MAVLYASFHLPLNNSNKAPADLNNVLLDLISSPNTEKLRLPTNDNM